MAIYKFRSRYQEQDTSYLLPENQPKSCWWKWTLCLYRLCCATRQRGFTSLLVLLALVAAGHNASSIMRIVDNQSQTQSHRQSFGYIDVPKWKWKSQRENFKRIHGTPRNLVQPASPQETTVWYDSNVQVDLTCPEEHQVGNHWWICNPSHLNKVRGCTIYSSGPPMGLFIESALQELMPSCDIHVFDPSNTTASVLESMNSSSVFVHPWGFAEASRTIVNPNNNMTLVLKSMKETMKELGHRKVDLLLLQCNGCEWTLNYADIHQVLVLMGDIRNVNFFSDMTSKHYALFHKQPIEVMGVLGRGQALSYLKLREAFFP